MRLGSINELLSLRSKELESVYKLLRMSFPCLRARALHLPARSRFGGGRARRRADGNPVISTRSGFLLEFTPYLSERPSAETRIGIRGGNDGLENNVNFSTLRPQGRGLALGLRLRHKLSRMLRPKAQITALGPPDGSRFFLPSPKKFDADFLPEVLID
jgi:hypothetical protein